MVDFAMEVHKSLYPDKEVPTSLKERRVEILNNFKRLQAETEQANIPWYAINTHTVGYMSCQAA